MVYNKFWTTPLTFETHSISTMMLFVGFFFSGFIILILFHCLIFVRKSHGTFFSSRLYVHTIPNLVVLLFISQLKWIDINFFFFSLFSFVFFALAIYRFFPNFYDANQTYFNKICRQKRTNKKTQNRLKLKLKMINWWT